MKRLINLNLTKSQIKVLKPLLVELNQGWDGVNPTGCILLQPEVGPITFTGSLSGQFIHDRYARIIYEAIKAYNEEEVE